MDPQTFQNKIFILKDRMFRFAKQMLDSEADAYDTVQDVMMKLWQQKEKLNTLDNKESYVMRCVKNECLNRQRHHKVVAKFQATKTKDDSTEIRDNYTTQMIVKMIKQLPEKQRLVVHLRDIEEYEINEIGALLDMEEGSVRINLMRGRQKLKSQLEKIWTYDQGKMGR